jgi:mono/diheme cytochrome c family protein
LLQPPFFFRQEVGIMKQISLIAVLLGLFCLTATMSVSAAEHQTPVAPQEFLDMENPVDEDDIDDAFLKKVKKTYKRKCSKCHGASGDGEGSASEEIEIKPTAFNTAGYFDEKSDGQLFWIIEAGSEGTEMEGYGPESDAGYSEGKLWELVSYIRASFSD